MHTSTNAASLPPLVKQYLQASLSNNTRRAYENDLAMFIRWGGEIPATPQQVAVYLAEHAEKLAVATLIRRVASICKAHEERGYASPTRSVVVKATIHGIRRTKANAQRRVLPISMKELNSMRRFFVGLKGLRDKALLLVGFAGAFRRSELVSIEMDDLTFSAKGVLIRVRRGKTDQEGMGRLVPVPYMKGVSCPVKALKEWLKRSGIKSGPVFRQVDRNGLLKGGGLSGQSVSLIVKSRMAQLGRGVGNFSGHSLRAGWVTSAAKQGASSWRICQQTGHKSEMSMNRYIRGVSPFERYPKLVT